MHGLVNKAIECFVKDTYGQDTWLDVTRVADLPVTEFEAMLLYRDTLTSLILDALARVLKRTREELMEDFGTYMVSHPTVDALRRLLRFGGVTFEDFLHSLDDLPDRARLAVPDLALPPLELHDDTPSQFRLICKSPIEGYGHFMMGILRALADDYGVLALIDHDGTTDDGEVISISLIETDFAEGRAFSLGGSTV